MFYCLQAIDSFYWTYVCHGQPGSCIRSDDPKDQTLSIFEVADQTHVDLFCCASVMGYDNVKIKMNPVGSNRNKVRVRRKQELDESWVVCATQHTFLRRESSRRQEKLTCKLILDNQLYSSFTSTIQMKSNLTITMLEKD